MKTLFIGGGNMAQAIIGGLDASEIHAIEPFAPARAAVESLGATSSAAFREQDLAARTIVLAVKPQVMREALAPLAGRLDNQLVVSIAAGVRCHDMAAWLGAGTPYTNIVRAMPNTPALIHAGISGLYAMPGVDAAGRDAAAALLDAVGETAWFAHEDMLDAVTAVSGSGPAYVFYFIEALEDAAREMGFPAETARKFALQTFLGGARLAAESAESPTTLRQRVTSKRGTTERAIDSFDQQKLRQGFIAAVKAARDRARELGDELRALSQGEA